MITLIWIVGIFALSFGTIGFGTAGMLHIIMKYILRYELPEDNYANVAFYGWFAWLGYIIYFFAMILFAEPLCDVADFILQQIKLFAIFFIFAAYYLKQDFNK